MKWLLIDSCGAQATLAVGVGERVLAADTLAGREFSAQWPAALRRLAESAGWTVGSLHVIGVVSGPGSFTGVRVGLAAAKGLCEATGARLVTLSRLAVLERLCEPGTVAALDAGRGEFYVRQGGHERLLTAEALEDLAQAHKVATTDPRTVSAGGGRVRQVVLGPVSALPFLLEALSLEKFADVAGADANYVRGETDIYAKPAVAGGPAR